MKHKPIQTNQKNKKKKNKMVKIFHYCDFSIFHLNAMYKTDKQVEQIVQLRLASKSLQRGARKCEREEQKKKKEVLAYLKKGNIEAARICAESSIRCRNEALNYLRLAARIDGVRSRVEQMQASQQVASQIGGVVKLMEKHLLNQNLQQATQVFEKFERQNEDLRVAEEVANETMSRTTAAMTPLEQVDDLICQVADEHSLEVERLLPGIDRAKIEERRAQVQAQSEGSRLEKLAA